MYSNYIAPIFDPKSVKTPDVINQFISLLYDINRLSEFKVNISIKIIADICYYFSDLNVDYLCYLFDFVKGIVTDIVLYHILNHIESKKKKELYSHLEIILCNIKIHYIKIHYGCYVYDDYKNVIHWCLKKNQLQCIDIFLKFGFDMYGFDTDILYPISFLFNPHSLNNLDFFFNHLNTSYKPLFLSIVEKDKFIIHDLWANIIFQYLYGTKTEIQQLWDKRILENLLATS